MSKSAKIRYRPNAAAILENSGGQIFVAERIDRPGAWQFPQGGIDGEESAKKAIIREIEEEIGIKKKHLKILESKEGYRYEFSHGRVKWGYQGQQQIYFRILFTGKKKHIRLDTKKPEFMDYRWIEPAQYRLKWLPSFKREVYKAVWRDFFDIELKD